MPRKPSARPMTPLGCIGFVSKIDPPTESQTGKTMMVVHISGEAASKNTRHRMMFKPEWFRKSFNPDDLSFGDLFVYNTNLASQDQVPALRAFLGSDAAVEEFDTAIETLDAAGELTGDNVASAITEAIERANTEGNVLVGYVLKQQRQDTGEVNEETGRKIKIATPYYEIGSFFLPTKRAFAKLQSRAAAATDEKPFDLAFDPGQYSVD